MENILRSKEYWQVVSEGIAGTATVDTQKIEIEGGQRLKDLKAKNYLFQAIYGSILDIDTSKQLWDSMKRKYQVMTRTKSTSYGVQNTSYEIRRVSYRVSFKNDGNCQQDADSQ
ncbi:hypothetical protein PanWU01x14_111800 [Parasponia andersonii]|uniref:Retrovirus-related Pol polyprotein from transposon TNT 1-94 n=1 Tax=Parasponia andersonii TaxID=3476 RepID=A0A2P5CYK5_PARAD|nr:hypothetical protein PanWU01x14_111800 [Parasponia andersonii]